MPRKRQVAVECAERIGRRRVDAFAGVNGERASEPERVGLKLSDVEFALAMASTKTTPSIANGRRLSVSAGESPVPGIERFVCESIGRKSNRIDQSSGQRRPAGGASNT
jgi:hypothetical protein